MPMATPPVENNWRKRVRVERTGDGANPPPAGFEDREDHRTPCASVQKKAATDYTDLHGQTKPSPRRIRANPCESVAELLGRDLLTRHGHCVLLRDGQQEPPIPNVSVCRGGQLLLADVPVGHFQPCGA